MRFLNTFSRDFFALLAGGFYTLAFAPYAYAYLAPLALFVLFASWQHASPVRALARGYLFGLSSFGLGVYWVYISIHDFGGADAWSATALTGIFVAFWALFPALAGWLSVKLHSKRNVIMIPLIWILIEYGRGYLLLNGFPWLLAAYSQLETPLAGYIPLVGAYGMGFLLTLSASAGVVVLRNKQHRMLLVMVIGVVWLCGGLLRAITWTTPIGKPLQVVLIQGNITQDQKWKPENKLNTLLLYKKLTEDNWGADVIVWPETAIPAFLSQVDAFFLQPLKQSALQHGTDVVISLPAEGKADDVIYNAVITLGKTTGMYRKNHLLPFGEYMPLQPLSGWVLKNLNIHMGDFTPGGDKQPLLQAGGYQFITTICYEDAFGDAGLAGLPAAAYLVNVTNDGWFGDSVEPHQHLQIARMRTIETGRFMLRATNTGATAVIAPNGKIIAQAPLFTATTLKASITPMGGMTPYARLGDKPVIAIMAIIFLVLASYDRFLSRY
ncbi:MAG: apolipoprotein N-acyltransferase [Methylovulum sp.]|nr:apolipoprotein N-acyltransferase [Methylovulum sp.]